MSQRNSLITNAFISFLCLFLVFVSSSTILAQEGLISAKDDYITCWKQPCVDVAGSEWSENNPDGVGVAVRMGTKPAVTDAEIKMVLTHDLIKNGVENVKFFYEQNDALATGITLHVRGGTEGVFVIGNVREQIPAIARRALNSNPLFRVD